MLLHEGMLFQLPGGIGIGKFRAFGEDGSTCELSIFNSVASQSTVAVSIAELRRAFLSPQTRVYVRKEQGYSVGRVRHYSSSANGLIDYEVRFPNGKDSYFSETELFVRPWRRPDDPAEVLAAGGAESQFLHDARLPARRALLELRSAAQGMTALTSAGIELVPHQIAAVGRILSDPVQRYLLADEVGLGKTIETGLVIRQRLIDNPETEVLVSVPRHLIPQWIAELGSKLRLSQFGERFEVCAHEDLALVTRTPDLLVVDEVHHLVGVVEGALAPAAARLGKLSHEAPSLLLLSATPVLGDETKFLTLLNLLDPVAHPINDIEGFRNKLAQRQTLGRALLSLDPQGSGLVLRQRSSELLELFPDDGTVQDIAVRLIEASKAKTPEVPALATALRQHVADTYRIHQRLIRSRRADAAGWEFRPRGPSVTEGEAPPMPHVREEIIDHPVIPDLVSGLEDWRAAAIAAIARGSAEETVVATRYINLLEATSIGCGQLHAKLTGKLIFPEEEGIRADLLRLTEKEECDRVSLGLAVQSIGRLRDALARETAAPKIVVFSSSHDRAEQLAALMPNALLLTEQSDRTCSETILAKFASPGQEAVLILDRSGEEGLNLSFADAIVHLDLPFSAARLEQRIGRLDRFGRTKDLVRHRVVLPSDDDISPWAAWQRVLAEGMQVYHCSISDVQFLLEDIEAQIARALLYEGPAAAEALIPEVQSRILAERRAQHEQSALDRIALAEEPAERLINAINDAEADEEAIEAAIEAWAVNTLQLRKQASNVGERDPFFWRPEASTLIPKEPWRELFDLFESEPLTWRRRIAMRRPNAALLRPGMPLIDTLERFTRWDDRGSAFVTWRKHSEWTGEPWMGFRICLIAEPGVAEENLLEPDPRQLAIARRAQQYFRQSYTLLHVEASGEPVSDVALNTILALPYTNERTPGRPWVDVNLGSRPAEFARIIDPSHFAEICRSVRDKSIAAFMESDEFRVQLSDAATAARADFDRRCARLQRRAATGEVVSNELANAEAVLAAVLHPSVRLDAMGFFIVTSLKP